MKKTALILILLYALLLPAALQAEQAGLPVTEQNSSTTKSTAKLKVTNEGAYLSDFSTEELKAFFTEMQYLEYINPPGNSFPRLFLKNIPQDFAALTDATERNQIFIKILMPLVLKINQEIMEEKLDLDAIRTSYETTGDFDEVDIYFLESLAKKYDVTTPFKDTRRYMLLLKELTRRIDIIPPSILISTAAIYTNWGTSRIAVQANNLYKIRDWYTTEGLEPIGENDDTYRYHIFPSLEESMRQYALKINSNVNYEQFWNSRKESRRRNTPIYGRRTSWTFVLANNLPNYAGLLDYTLTYYRMHTLDTAQLESEYDFTD